MKYIFILAVIAALLTACGENKEISINEKIETGEENRRELRSTDLSEEVEVTLGEAFTVILDTGINRVNNIKIACEAISGKELLPGEEFSFNNIVGKRSSSNGYKDAPIIFHGEKSYGIGGGVCQVSSTVYMAAVDAGLQVTERHTHSEKVSYAPGTDATVVYGEKDMRFVNNTEDIVFIYTWVQDENVYSKIIKKEVAD